MHRNASPLHRVHALYVKQRIPEEPSRRVEVAVCLRVDGNFCPAVVKMSRRPISRCPHSPSLKRHPALTRSTETVPKDVDDAWTRSQRSPCRVVISTCEPRALSPLSIRQSKYARGYERCVLAPLLNFETKLEPRRRFLANGEISRCLHLR